jgi:hypothetical protein
LHEGNEVQGKYGKQGWSIACRCIAIAMDQGGSIKIGSQIFPEFVQVQSVFFIIHDIRAKLFEINHKYHKSLPPSCNMRARVEFIRPFCIMRRSQSFLAE